jgi:hypothetical protein
MAKKGLLLGMLVLAFGFVLAGCASSATGTGTSELVIQWQHGRLGFPVDVYVDGEIKASLPSGTIQGVRRGEDTTNVIVVPNGKHTVWIQHNSDRSEQITVRTASSRTVFKITSDVFYEDDPASGLIVSNRVRGLGLEFTKISETKLGN